MILYISIFWVSNYFRDILRITSGSFTMGYSLYVHNVGMINKFFRIYDVILPKLVFLG